ncbi:DUF3794 and LysM peptidoglycan-binding domain-containing protein [Clostridium cylindrosporum]|uniref:Peptidoglycan-binding LysM n=1 Tax=Clostridium cylindrosporum DSM 605 TaxID=1121307 RepID=A0A0J8DEZ1_CLOCY|nr:SPOCS domain-containing protein [Clostridium cylindrosporum]KMT22824.1 peptidoglycan-binding LysM [Clostridium cylindrosporum DSM 605]
MSAQLLKDTVNYERLVGEGTGQTMVSQDLVLSDRNPEIGKVLSIDGRVNIISAETSEEKVAVDGKITVDIFYASSEDSKGIYKLSSSSNFTQNINLPQSDGGMKSITEAKIEHIEYEIVSNRKIKVNSIINLESVVYSRENVEVVVDIKGEEIQLLRNNLEFSEYLGEDKSQSIVKVNINIPEDKEEVSSILKSDVTIHRKEVTVGDGKILVSAAGTARVMYDTSSEDVHTIDEEFSFEAEIGSGDLRDGSKCDVGFKVSDVYESIIENDVGERRQIEIEAAVDVSAKSYGVKNLQSIVDAYSPDEGYEFEKVTVKSLSFYSEGSDSQTIKERINLDAEEAPIEQVKYVSLRPIITELKVIDDKVIGEGILETNILYLVSGEEGGISNYEDEIAFKTSIDIKGAKIDMVPNLEVNVEHISFDKISARELDLKIILSAGAKLTQKSTFELIKNVVEVELPENLKNMPTFIIYSVDKNDNLWKIAKRYATTIEDIVKLNDIENPEVITSGTKIIIPKKAFIG